MYTFDYQVEEACAALSLSLNTELYLAGDKYNVQHLKEIALRKLKEVATQRVTRSSELNLFADLENAAKLAWDAATVSQHVREVLIDLILRRQRLKLTVAEGKHLEQIMLENSGMATEVLEAAVSRCLLDEEGTMYRCPSCLQRFATSMEGGRSYTCPACSRRYASNNWRDSFKAR